MMLKIILIIAGTISLTIGILGIFIPGLPSTPFLLITAGLYIKSSDRLYNIIIKNRIIGPQLRDFQSKRGMTKKTKMISVILMWTMIIISAVFFIPSYSVKVLLIILGLIGTFVMSFIVKTIDK